MNVLQQTVELNAPPEAYSATARAREILETLRHQRKQFEEKRVIVLKGASNDTSTPSEEHDDVVTAIAVTPHKLREASQQRRDRFDKHLLKETSSRAPSEATPVTEASTSHPAESSSLEDTSIIIELPKAAQPQDHAYPIPLGLKSEHSERRRNDVFRKEKRPKGKQLQVRQALSYDGTSTPSGHRGSLRQTKSHEESQTTPAVRPSKQKSRPKIRKSPSHYHDRRRSNKSAPAQQTSCRSMSFDTATKRSTPQQRIRETKSFGNENSKAPATKEKSKPKRERSTKRHPSGRRRSMSKEANMKSRRSHSCDAFRGDRRSRKLLPREGLPLAPSLDSAFPPIQKSFGHKVQNDRTASKLTLRDVEIPLELSPIHRWGSPPRTDGSPSPSKRSVSPGGVVVPTGDARSPYLHKKYEDPRQDLVDTMRVLEKRRSGGQRSSLADMASQASWNGGTVNSRQSGELEMIQSAGNTRPQCEVKDISGLSLSNENDRHALLRLLQSDLAEPKATRTPLDFPTAPQSDSSSSEEDPIISDDSSCELTTTTEQLGCLNNPMLLVGIPEGEDCDVSCLTMPPLPLVKEPGYKVDKTDKLLDDSLLAQEVSDSGRNLIEAPNPPLRKDMQNKEEAKGSAISTESEIVASAERESKRRRRHQRSNEGAKQHDHELEDKPSRDSLRKSKSHHHNNQHQSRSSSRKSSTRGTVLETRPHRSVPAQGGLYQLACQSGLTPEKLASRSSFTVTTRNLSQRAPHALRGARVPTAESNHTCGAYNTWYLAKSCGNRRGRKHLIPFFDKALYAIAEDESNGAT